jgi:hypothetical protein
MTAQFGGGLINLFNLLCSTPTKSGRSHTSDFSLIGLFLVLTACQASQAVKKVFTMRRLSATDLTLLQSSIVWTLAK